MTSREEVIEELNKLSKQLNDLKEKVKCGSMENYLFKKIEDGILGNLENASEKQLKLLETYPFKYYTSLNDKETLRQFIKSRLREVRLGKLLDKLDS